MSKSDKKFGEEIEKLQTNLDEYSKVQEPIFKDALVDLGTKILKQKMLERSEKIGK